MAIIGGKLLKDKRCARREALTYKMTKSFWALCIDSLVAFHQHKQADAVRLLAYAKLALGRDGISDDHLVKRQQYFEMLWSHIQGKRASQEKAGLAGESNAAINVLFVLPDSIDSSYGYSALNVAKRLARQNVNCAVAVPNADGASANSTALPVKSFIDIKKHGTGLPRGGRIDIIHVWTAQECVREFCVEIQKSCPAKLVIHLQNNEEYLTEKILGKPWKQLQAIPLSGIKKEQENRLFHPQHGHAWLNKADGFSLEIDTLKRFNLAGAPSVQFPPVVDENLFYPRPLNTVLRNKLGIPREHVVIVLPSTVQAANQDEIGMLYQAVESLNCLGIPTTLIRTGKNRDPRVVSAWPSSHVKDLGWVARKYLPDIMAAADLFVQPGVPGAYNDHRVPTKLLEYFAMGRPVILPHTNLGLKAVHGQEAYVLDKANTDGIVKAVSQIKADQTLCTRLTKGAVDFYLKHAAHHQCRDMQQLYRTVLSSDQKERSKQVQQVKDTGNDQSSIAAPSISPPVTDNGELKKLQYKIKKLELQKTELSERLLSMPSIDPLCISDPTFTWPVHDKEEFGIILFGHTRLDALSAVLESLGRQDALKDTEVWLDGFQGNHTLKLKIEKTIELIKKYPVKHLHKQAGNFGFRKMLILGLVEMCKKYRDILILEDDCFPTHDAVSEFRKELDLMREDKSIFSVYGHHFLSESEKETCPRFQGWGWATTSEKLMPILLQLIDCYSMTEDRYLKFVNLTLTSEIKARIDVTHPRQPSYTLEKFFAWDETLCLLTALNNQVHRPTKKRTIYNCGMGTGSTHFDENDMFRKPPFNLITPEEVWQYF